MGEKMDSLLKDYFREAWALYEGFATFERVEKEGV